mmetsp:Transcript_133862/g.373241  ORF Transcript_133862/g.373241 Transcript_133862/m.373241 type:complete len:318 (-) Transcript_133862:798-1751(-)
MRCCLRLQRRRLVCHQRGRWCRLPQCGLRRQQWRVPGRRHTSVGSQGRAKTVVRSGVSASGIPAQRCALAVEPSNGGAHAADLATRRPVPQLATALLVLSGAKALPGSRPTPPARGVVKTSGGWSIKIRVGCELPHLVVEPLTGIGGLRFSFLSTNRVRRSARRIRQHAPVVASLTAAIRVPRCLQPEVCVHKRGIRRLRGRWHPDAGSANVAPVRAVPAVADHAVPASVDEHVRIHVEHSPRNGRQTGCVVHLVIAEVPLLQEITRVLTAGVLSMPAVEAVAVAVAAVWTPGTLHAQGLVASHVGREAAYPVQWQL